MKSFRGHQVACSLVHWQKALFISKEAVCMAPYQKKSKKTKLFIFRVNCYFKKKQTTNKLKKHNEPKKQSLPLKMESVCPESDYKFL